MTMPEILEIYEDEGNNCRQWWWNLNSPIIALILRQATPFDCDNENGRNYDYNDDGDGDEYDGDREIDDETSTLQSLISSQAPQPLPIIAPHT